MEKLTTGRTWKPKLAGIFTIICGATEIWGSLLGIVNAWSQRDTYIAVSVYMVGLIAILGGILALGRRVWWLALTGTICALLGSVLVPGMLMIGPPLPPGALYAPGWVWVVVIGMPLSILGISAIVLTVLSKGEFS